MNKAILVGRLTRDPEVRYTQSGIAVCTFTLAVDRRFVRKDANNPNQQTADFIPIVAWRKLAEFCGNNLTKGLRVGVEGRIQVRTYDAQDGSKRYVTEIVADDVEFLESRREQAHNGYGAAPAQQPAPQQTTQSNNNNGFGGGNDLSDEEIPF